MKRTIIIGIVIGLLLPSLLHAPLLALSLLTAETLWRLYMERQRNRDLQAQVEKWRAELSETSQRLTREIAEREDMQRDLLLLDMAVTQTAEGIAISDMEGYNQFVNKAWADMHGYTQEELQDSHMSLFHTKEQFQEDVEPFIRQVMFAGHHEGEDTHVKKDGTSFHTWMSVNVVKDPEGTPVAIVGACRDITQRRKAQEALQKAKEAAEAANHAKSIFLANMSHELRTPLNGILGYAQILQRRRDLDSSVQGGLSIIQHSGEHLLMLINDILDLSKIEARKMELHPAELHLPDFLNGVAGIVRMRAQQKAVHFVYQPGDHLPNSILADETRLRQVLLNLLGNAVKFTDGGGTVAFRVSFIDNYQLSIINCQLRFEISDTGVGMTAEQMAKIFEPFEQVGDTERRAEGTGLGLAISQQLVHLMGGEIQVTSEAGQGSTFWFEAAFPLVKAAPREPSVRRGDISGYAGERRKILVVDDHQENRLVLRNLLEPIGFEVSSAENGQEGIDAAKERQPDLILMDLVMPVMNGFEAVNALRRMPEFKATPILAVSASALETDHEHSRRVGCDGFLPKPVEAQRLFNFMETSLSLEWLYEDAPAEEAQPGEVAETDIVAPPQEELEVLYELVMLGVMERIEERALYLEELDAAFRPFAAKLRELAGNYDTRRLLALIEGYLEEQA